MLFIIIPAILQIILTIIAWRRGWKLYALIPAAIAYGFQIMIIGIFNIDIALRLFFISTFIDHFHALFSMFSILLYLIDIGVLIYMIIRPRVIRF